MYFWKTTLDWTASDSARMEASGVDRIGLRLFDWGVKGEEGTLVVRSAIPGRLTVVPVVYVTVERLRTWARMPDFDAKVAAAELMDHMDRLLAVAWSGTPRVWQLDADWSAGTRASWFAVAQAFGLLVHQRGGRFEVTVRLHQLRDRATQGVPPADGGVLMLYGVGDAVLDDQVVRSYIKGEEYPIPLVPAFPVYTQVRQNNGYGRLVALHRLGGDSELPTADLVADGPDRFTVVRRSTLGGRVLLAHDQLVIDRVNPGVLAAVAKLPEVAALRRVSGDRVWVFDYDPQEWEALIHGPLAPYLFPR